MPPFRLIVSRRARRDFDRIINASRRQFGDFQAERYLGLLITMHSVLANKPFHPCSKARDELYPGVRSFHIRHTKRGARAAHYTYYMVPEDAGVLWIVRYLHERTDPPRHIAKKDLVSEAVLIRLGIKR